MAQEFSLQKAVRFGLEAYFKAIEAITGKFFLTFILLNGTKHEQKIFLHEMDIFLCFN